MTSQLLLTVLLTHFCTIIQGQRIQNFRYNTIETVSNLDLIDNHTIWHEIDILTISNDTVSSCNGLFLALSTFVIVSDLNDTVMYNIPVEVATNDNESMYHYDCDGNYKTCSENIPQPKICTNSISTAIPNIYSFDIFFDISEISQDLNFSYNITNDTCTTSIIYQIELKCIYKEFVPVTTRKVRTNDNNGGSKIGNMPLRDVISIIIGIVVLLSIISVILFIIWLYKKQQQYNGYVAAKTKELEFGTISTLLSDEEILLQENVNIDNEFYNDEML